MRIPIFIYRRGPGLRNKLDSIRIAFLKLLTAVVIAARKKYQAASKA